MFGNRRILAVVPARSGSKGLPDKNMSLLGGVSLIARAAQTLAALPWIDSKIISTDSRRYADEAIAHGLEAPFLRPPHLATDIAGAVETIQHAVIESEREGGGRFDVILIVEPTSPFRRPEDLEAAVSLLLAEETDSVVTVSPIDSKFHPQKIFDIGSGWLRYYDPRGADITSRQQLSPLYTRNGICYAVRRTTLMDQGQIVGTRTKPLVIERPLVNIDGPLDLAIAEALFARTRAEGQPSS
jgi:CMP-N-acetylneuraminic acid synthetase